MKIIFYSHANNLFFSRKVLCLAFWKRECLELRSGLLHTSFTWICDDQFFFAWCILWQKKKLGIWCMIGTPSFATLQKGCNVLLYMMFSSHYMITHLLCIPQERSLNCIWLLVSFFAGCSSVNWHWESNRMVRCWSGLYCMAW